MNIRELESAAIAAHAAGKSFTAFWNEYGANVGQAEPHNARKFGMLYRRLMALVICGDDAGMMPVGDDCPWFRDDEQHKPADVGTAAKWQGLQRQKA